MGKDEAFNMRLIAHDDLNGFGNGGEGMSMQVAGDGRRVLWIAHESAPVNFTGVDVTDPRKPRVFIPQSRDGNHHFPGCILLHSFLPMFSLRIC